MPVVAPFLLLPDDLSAVTGDLSTSANQPPAADNNSGAMNGEGDLFRGISPKTKVADGEKDVCMSSRHCTSSNTTAQFSQWNLDCLTFSPKLFMQRQHLMTNVLLSIATGTTKSFFTSSFDKGQISQALNCPRGHCDVCTKHVIRDEVYANCPPCSSPPLQTRNTNPNAPSPPPLGVLIDAGCGNGSLISSTVFSSSLSSLTSAGYVPNVVLAIDKDRDLLERETSLVLRRSFECPQKVKNFLNLRRTSSIRGVLNGICNISDDDSNESIIRDDVSHVNTHVVLLHGDLAAPSLIMGYNNSLTDISLTTGHMEIPSLLPPLHPLKTKLFPQDVHEMLQRTNRNEIRSGCCSVSVNGVQEVGSYKADPIAKHYHFPSALITSIEVLEHISPRDLEAYTHTLFHKIPQELFNVAVGTLPTADMEEMVTCVMDVFVLLTTPNSTYNTEVFNVLDSVGGSAVDKSNVTSISNNCSNCATMKEDTVEDGNPSVLACDYIYDNSNTTDDEEYSEDVKSLRAAICMCVFGSEIKEEGHHDKKKQANPSDIILHPDSFTTRLDVYTNQYIKLRHHDHFFELSEESFDIYVKYVQDTLVQRCSCYDGTTHQRVRLVGCERLYGLGETVNATYKRCSSEYNTQSATPTTTISSQTTTHDNENMYHHVSVGTGHSASHAVLCHIQLSTTIPRQNRQEDVREVRFNEKHHSHDCSQKRSSSMSEDTIAITTPVTLSSASGLTDVVINNSNKYTKESSLKEKSGHHCYCGVPKFPFRELFGLNPNVADITSGCCSHCGDSCSICGAPTASQTSHVSEKSQTDVIRYINTTYSERDSGSFMVKDVEGVTLSHITEGNIIVSPNKPEEHCHVTHEPMQNDGQIYTPVSVFKTVEIYHLPPVTVSTAYDYDCEEMRDDDCNESEEMYYDDLQCEFDNMSFTETVQSNENYDHSTIHNISITQCNTSCSAKDPCKGNNINTNTYVNNLQFIPGAQGVDSRKSGTSDCLEVNCHSIVSHMQSSSPAIDAIEVRTGKTPIHLVYGSEDVYQFDPFWDILHDNIVYSAVPQHRAFLKECEQELLPKDIDTDDDLTNSLCNVTVAGDSVQPCTSSPRQEKGHTSDISSTREILVTLWDIIEGRYSVMEGVLEIATMDLVNDAVSELAQAKDPYQRESTHETYTHCNDTASTSERFCVSKGNVSRDNIEEKGTPSYIAAARTFHHIFLYRSSDGSNISEPTQFSSSDVVTAGIGTIPVSRRVLGDSKYDNWETTLGTSSINQISKTMLLHNSATMVRAHPLVIRELRPLRFFEDSMFTKNNDHSRYKYKCGVDTTGEKNNDRNLIYNIYSSGANTQLDDNNKYKDESVIVQELVTNREMTNVTGDLNKKLAMLLLCYISLEGRSFFIRHAQCSTSPQRESEGNVGILPMSSVLKLFSICSTEAISSEERCTLRLWWTDFFENKLKFSLVY